MKETRSNLTPDNRWIARLAYPALLGVMIGAAALAASVQQGFGGIEVTNAWYHNDAGVPVRAKRYRPLFATPSHRVPGVVYIPGYQNNRETGDPFCIELARRGFAAMCIDAIGRGNSGLPSDPSDPHFDKSFGARASLAHLRSLNYVDPSRIGMMGNSLGAKIAYDMALGDPEIHALVITGFAFDKRATFEAPRNMLMLFGRYDEFRDRMTASRDVAREWMEKAAVRAAIPVKHPKPFVTYGSFASGTARRIEIPEATHLQVTYTRGPVAASLRWMKEALRPDPRHWLDEDDQTWPIKEWATLVALIACLFSAMPLGLLLLSTRFFSPLPRGISFSYTASAKEAARYAGVNALLMWLYLPLFFLLFGIHFFVVRLDGAFPMMLVNGIVFWFLVINLVGFLLFVRWMRRLRRNGGVTLCDLGLSDVEDRFGLDRSLTLKALLLGLILFGAVYLTAHIVEQCFMVDLRFIFPFASDLTVVRALLFPRYFPFVLAAFIATGLFLHVQLRRPPRRTWLGTWLDWSAYNTAVLVLPLALMLLAQYGPLLTTGVIPFVGPGGAFVSMVINLFHIVGVLCLVIPVSTWFFQITGRPWVGAVWCAATVTWMYTSSQVIAPVPL